MWHCDKEWYVIGVFSTSVFTDHHGDGEQDGECFPSGCCSLQECDHPLAACLQRWDAAGQAGCLPCPESLPSRCRWCQCAPPRGW